MRKTAAMITAALLFLAALAPVQAANAQALPLIGEASALNLEPVIPGIEIPKVPIPTLKLPVFTLIPLPTATPKPTIKLPEFTLIPLPTATPKPTIKIPEGTLIPVPIPLPEPEKPAEPAPTATSQATKKPQLAPKAQAQKGAEVTSFGLYFEELRPKLTDTWYMFTPLDLTDQGMLTYPMVANNATIVGSVIITVAGGQLTVTYQPAPGVTTTREFFTLFPSLDAIQTLNVDLLAGQARPFGQPIDIQQAFGEDRKVILYLNNLADYDAAKSGLAAFVPEQHRAFMQNLLPLLD
ncbi:MAG: hypothetical protein PHP02_08875 [Eubacteriales bacterium]|nr:hypothetical protein [Eubacteriales bacterium]